MYSFLPPQLQASLKAPLRALRLAMKHEMRFSPVVGLIWSSGKKRSSSLKKLARRPVICKPAASTSSCGISKPAPKKQKQKHCTTLGCPKGARAGSVHCIACGGGPRCVEQGCSKAVRRSGALCLSHACPGCRAAAALEPVPVAQQRLCAAHRLEASTQELLRAGGVDASPASLAFDAIGPEEERILSAVVFSSIHDTGVAEQLTQAQLEARVRLQVAAALTQAASLGL